MTAIQNRVLKQFLHLCSKYNDNDDSDFSHGLNEVKSIIDKLWNGTYKKKVKRAKKTIEIPEVMPEPIIEVDKDLLTNPA